MQFGQLTFWTFRDRKVPFSTTLTTSRRPTMISLVSTIFAFVKEWQGQVGNLSQRRLKREDREILRVLDLCKEALPALNIRVPWQLSGFWQRIAVGDASRRQSRL
jgi:hypothetical protein